MWIVRVALQRPYTFVVMAMLIVLLGAGAIIRTPTDVFPDIDIPVISVIWFYNGLPTEEMEKRITIYSEYSTSATVNNIKHIESQTLNGIAVVKLYFQPNVKIEQAFSQVTAISQSILFRMPPGTKPPIVIQYNASSVPILQLSLSSKTLSEAEVYDWGIFKLRQQLAVIQGITIPAPYGGKVRQIQVDIDPERLHEKGLSPLDVANAVSAQSLMLPTGRARIGPIDYTVSINSSPKLVSQFDDIPIKYVNGAWVLMRDVAHVRDGFAVQQNVVRRDGTKGALVTIMKGQGASTLDIVNQVKALMPRIKASAPPGLEIELLFDQSLFVTAAVRGMVMESVIAACLTAALILLFLGSWRSTLIIAVSIPLSVLCSLAILSALGMTINVMTLGGLALAVGILVDDATVEIENIHRNLAQGKRIEQAVLDGAHQIAIPAFVGTLTICIVFVSVVFLDGPAKFLFVPLALAVVFAMLASYLLSRTLVPVMAKYLLAGEHQQGQSVDPYSVWSQAVGPMARVHDHFNKAFDWTRERYLAALDWTLVHRKATLGAFGLLLASGAALVPWVGRDFFPSVDTGQFRLHVNASAGTRLEETQRRFSEVENEIRKVIPPTELKLVIDNIGVPAEPFNFGFGDGATLGQSDGEILVSLNQHHSPTADYQRQLRLRLREKFPDLEFYFQPADIVSQILNFGLAAPIDVRVQGFERDENLRLARELRDKIARLPGAEDVHVHQITAAPDLRVSVDRVRAASLGLTEQDVANDVLVSLSGTTETAPNFWLDPVSGIPYLISIQTPPYRIDSLNAVGTTPIVASGVQTPELLGNFATIEHRDAVQSVTHSDIQPTFDVYASPQDRDLGGLTADIERVVQKVAATAPATTRVEVRGQADSMQTAFVQLGIGIAFAAVLVYLLMVVNFQSWTEPFVIITALPGGMAGIVWMLYVTGTTFSVPSLMGTIMTVGVATANSILLVTFANERRSEGMSPLHAVLAAGQTRLRPVVMTATAMVLGMLPMSFGLGEGGEQNAPLGRAVIGGLTVATVSTLFLVPLIYVLVRSAQSEEQSERNLDQNPQDVESRTRCGTE